MKYKVQDCTIAFPLSLFHKSHYFEEKKMKLCLFQQNVEEIIYSKNGDKQVTRRAKVRQQQVVISKHAFQWSLFEKKMINDEIYQLCPVENKSQEITINYYDSENETDNQEKR